jgi:hypothetical protein
VICTLQPRLSLGVPHWGFFFGPAPWPPGSRSRPRHGNFIWEGLGPPAPDERADYYDAVGERVFPETEDGFREMERLAGEDRAA